ncbi:MAG: hypothetical protein AAGD96_16505, partial [Chloroflexota bacterium]
VIKGTEMHAFIGSILSEFRLSGHPIELQVGLTDASGPVRGAKVVADVVHPDGDVQQITLVDDGGPFDAIANDGVYGFVYDRINRPLEIDEFKGKTWIFDIVAEGTNNNGESFVRYKRLSYTPFVREKQGTLDNDFDGMLDRWELRFEATNLGVDDGDLDFDEDGLTNREEFELGTNPDMADTDRGGETDGSEVAQGRNPLLTADDKIAPITNFRILNLPERVMLEFDPDPGYTAVRVFRRTGLGGPFTELGEADASNGFVVDAGLVNDQDYFYMIQPLGESGITGRRTIALYAEPAADPYQPEGIVMINHEDEFTDQINVKVQFMGVVNGLGELDVSHFQISNTPDLSGVPWQPFSQEIAWAIDPDPDTDLAMIYVRFRDKAGNVSDTIFGDGILYAPKSIVPWPGVWNIGWLVATIKDAYFEQFEILFTPLNGIDLSGLNSNQSRSAANEEEPPVLLYAGRSFSLEANLDKEPIDEFEVPYTFTINYEDWQWQNGGVGDEESLNLYINTGKSWEPMLPCDGCKLNTDTNEIIIQTDKLGDFAILGEAPTEPEMEEIFLPMIQR